MDHVAIMRKSWGLTEKIISGQKKLESRWYKFKYRPWDEIKVGDKIFFKNSGEPVTIKANVSEVIRFSNLDKNEVRKLLEKYYKDDGIEKNDVERFFNLFKDKKYCILIFLKNPRKVKPFEINKKGFGFMASWISCDSIGAIKVKH